MASLRSTARRHLDAELRPLADAQPRRPPRGWLRAIRNAVGMSTAEMAQRLGVAQARISQLEAAEAAGTIKLATLERAAQALNCRLSYALIPNEPLETMVRAQAIRKAAEQVGQVAQHMRLEDQEVGAVGTRSLVEELADELVDRRGLWASTAAKH